MAALLVSAAMSFFAVAQFLPLLPGGALGFLVAALVVVAAAIGVVTFERAFVWGTWLQPRGEPIPTSLRSSSVLLSGHAPPPFATGLVLGALLAARLS